MHDPHHNYASLEAEATLDNFERVKMFQHMGVRRIENFEFFQVNK